MVLSLMCTMLPSGSRGSGVVMGVQRLRSSSVAVVVEAPRRRRRVKVGMAAMLVA
jgi:hypothetical protein